MRYYCTKCGSQNLRKKTKSNYGFALAILDLLFFAAAFFTYGLSLVFCLVIACCVKKTTVCRKCGGENCLVPMDSPVAQSAIRDLSQVPNQ